MYSAQLVFISLAVCGSVLPAEAVTCPVPYVDIGGRCLLVEVLTGGTWEEMAKFCDDVSKGSLLSLNSLTVYVSIIEYLRANGLSNYSFWTDGNDIVLEGHFFHKNGNPVYMGTPYWTYLCNSQGECGQEPLGGEQENCVEMDGRRFYYLNDVDCNANKHVICQL